MLNLDGGSLAVFTVAGSEVKGVDALAQSE